MIFNLIKHARELLFNNTKSGLEATNVQDAIDEISTNLEKNNLGGATNLKTYNSTSNRFTIPDDGYVCMYGYAEDNSGGTLVITGADRENAVIYMGGKGYSFNSPYYNSIFVKAGMTVYCDTFTGAMVAFYTPLN